MLKKDQQSSAVDDTSQMHASVCRALADPKRIQILYALHRRPRHVSALAYDLNLPQPTVSRHLRILKQLSLVVGQRNGPAVVYDINDERIIDVLDLVHDVMVDRSLNRNFV